jgi:DNA-binding LacI/PurR family transcriptional regulator
MGAVKLLDEHPDLDAIFCSSDTLAHGVLIEAQSRGLRVPEDLAIMGFGDLNFPATPIRRCRPSRWTGRASARCRRRPCWTA